MVLKKNIARFRSGLVANQDGITLLELIVSIALSSLVAAMAMAFFRDAGHAAWLSRSHQETGVQSQALFSSLSENLLAGGGVLKLSERRLLLLNGRNKKVDYVLEDSTLFINGKPQSLKIGEFRVEGFGPERPNLAGSYREMQTPWELDSLDDNRDGQIIGFELDRNRDDTISAEECRYVGHYEISLKSVDRGLTTSLKAIIHPRNHLTAIAFQNADKSEDDIFGSGF